MKKVLSLIKSSLHDIRCCDETVTTPVDGVVLLWRALASSLTCLLDGNGKHTGYVHPVTLEQYNAATGLATGVTKVNNPGDPNFIADYLDTALCPYRQLVLLPQTFTLANHVDNIAGEIDVVDGVTIPFDVGYYQSLPSLGGGIITFTVKTRSFDVADAPLPAIIDVNGTLYESMGDLTLSIQSPIYSIDIRHSDAVPL